LWREPSSLVTTRDGDVPAAVRAMKAGAADVLQNPALTKTSSKAIESALKQQDQKDAVGERRDAAEATRLIEFLSPREHEVFNALAAGRPTKVMAFNLGIGVRTD
jgi:two-component system, LuxR family, response regulator FixJ